MDRTEVLERMQPILSTQVRTLDAQPKTRIVVTPDMVTLRPGSGQRHLEMTKEGVQSLANFVGLPWNLAAQLRPDTFSDVTSELLQRKTPYAVMLRDNAIVAVQRPADFHTVNPERALRAIEQGIHGIEYHRLLILDNFVVSLELLGEKREPVTRGDLIRAGAQVTFSPIGTVEPMVQAYALRLVCTNGLTSNTVLREFHFSGGGRRGGEGDDIWQWFRNSARDAYNSLSDIITRYRQMIDEQIAPEDRAAMLEAMLKVAKLSGEDANAVRALAIQNPPENTYQMMNLITQATSHLIEDPRRVRQAQLAVASYTNESEHARICPVCHARRN